MEQNKTEKDYLKEEIKRLRRTKSEYLEIEALKKERELLRQQIGEIKSRNQSGSVLNKLQERFGDIGERLSKVGENINKSVGGKINGKK